MSLLKTSRLWRWGAVVVALLLLVGVGMLRLNVVDLPVAADPEFAPSPFPDRIILTWTGDPATTQAVTWRTDASVEAPVAQIARAVATPDLEAQAHLVTGSSTPSHSENGVAHHHSVEFQGLEPGALYAYRVGNGKVWSEWFHFRTASRSAEPFTFIYFGDAQNGLQTLWSRVIRAAYADAPDVRFMIHAGDLVNQRDGNHDSEWGAWFKAGGWLHGTIPSIPAPGNHDYLKDWQLKEWKEVRHLSPHWRSHFTLPVNGPVGMEETAYYLDYQGVRIIVLNSLEAVHYERAAEQAHWMEPLLANNPNRWTVVVFHHPVFSIRRGRYSQTLRTHWQSLFERYDVDLVLQGHDHAYARTADEQLETTARDSVQGPIYVVSIGGAKMYDIAEASEWMDRLGEDIQLYQIIRVGHDRLSFAAKTATGEVYDAFELIKEGDGSKRLVDRRPSLPTHTGIAARVR